MINPKLAQALYDRYGVYHLSELNEQQALELAQILESIDDNNSIVISREKAGKIKNLLEYNVQIKRDLAKSLPQIRDVIKQLGILEEDHSLSFCSCLSYMANKLSVKE